VSEKNVTAEELSGQFKAISVAEFFEKNRHLLGFENPTKALITIVKELVDNSLDACEESRILPNLKVSVKEVSTERYKISVEDNGPGIVPEKLTSAFGKLLYGTKFHRLRMSRGQQGIGVSGSVLYSQLTTGKPSKITSSTGKDIHMIDLMIDVAKNEPNVLSQKIEKNPKGWRGLKIEMESEGRYIEKGASIPEYLKQTAISNPFAKIVYDGPNGKLEFERAVNELPKQPREIKPHPYGVEIGLLRRMLHATKTRNIIGFMTEEFSRVGRGTAEQICRLSKIDTKKKPSEITHEEMERLHKSMQMVKLVSPPTDCLSPLGEKLLLEGLKKETGVEFSVAVLRPPSVYRGMPFLIEVAMGYGGQLPTDKTAVLYRFANKVPLLYHQSDCATTEAVVDTDFRRYGFSQSSGQLPSGPLVILVHFASVWVPYTSEGKQAIADYPEIMKEIKLALQDAGRRLSAYVRHKNKLKDKQLRRELFEKYIPELAESLEKLTDKQRKKIIEELEKIAKKGEIVGKEESNTESTNNG
jgi:DNA topoisomerase VI subunit B